MKRHLGGREHNDQGASLIFALILITVVAVVTGALLTVGSTNFAATAALRQVAGTAYAADTAGKVAINDIVQGQNSGIPNATYPPASLYGPNGWVYDNASDGTGCFGKDASGNPLGPASSPLTIPNVYSDAQSNTTLTATIVCNPVAGTGIYGSKNVVKVPNPSTDPFARSLTTVGTVVNGSCTAAVTVNSGICITSLGTGGNAYVPMRGSIESNNFFNVTNGVVLTNGTTTANPNSSCTPAASIIPACSGSYSTPATLASPLSSAPAYVNPDNYTASCHFPSGYYNNAAQLSTDVNSCPIAYFDGTSPYYFDFTDSPATWNIANEVIGGTPTGSSAIPGSCQSPIDSPTAVTGVQFVFGGTSAVALGNNARVELCGSTNAGNAPLTVYEQQTDVAGANGSQGPVGANTVVDGGGSNAFKVTNVTSPVTTMPQAVASVGNNSVTWTSTKKNNTGTLNLSDFAGLSSLIPGGSTVTSAQLKVTYSGKFTAANFKAGVLGQSATTTVAASGSNTDITVPVAAAIGTGAFTSTNPTVQLKMIDSASGDNVVVDAVSLTVSYTTPAMHKQTTAQAFITSGTNFGGQFLVQGATYAPFGYINIGPGNCNAACQSSNLAMVAFRWGLYAYGVNFKAQPSQPWGYPLVSIPDAGYGLGSQVTGVDLKVYLCTGTSACSTSGIPSLTSRVLFTDGVNATGVVNPKPGQRQVQILSWAEQK